MEIAMDFLLKTKNKLRGIAVVVRVVVFSFCSSWFPISYTSYYYHSPDYGNFSIRGAKIKGLHRSFEIVKTHQWVTYID